MRSVHGNRARQSRRRGDERRAEGIRSRRRLEEATAASAARRPAASHSSASSAHSSRASAARARSPFVGSETAPDLSPGFDLAMAARCQPYVAPHLPPPREGDVAATISVPHRRVGLIIGRGGENVRFLQQQTRAHVQVQPERDVHPAQTERLVYLRGGRDACAEAARMIQDLVDGRARVGTAGLAPPQPPGMIVSHGAAIRGEHATARRRTGWNGVFGGGAYAGGASAGGDSPPCSFAGWGRASRGLASAGLASAPAPAPAPSPAAAAAVAAVERERQDRHNQMYLAAAASTGGAYVPSPAAVAPAYARERRRRRESLGRARGSLRGVPRARTRRRRAVLESLL